MSLGDNRDLVLMSSAQFQDAYRSFDDEGGPTKEKLKCLIHAAATRRGTSRTFWLASCRAAGVLAG